MSELSEGKTILTRRILLCKEISEYFQKIHSMGLSTVKFKYLTFFDLPSEKENSSGEKSFGMSLQPTNNSFDHLKMTVVHNG